jgi:hypothetical protein
MMADNVVNTECTFEYICAVIDNYSKDTRHIKLKLKLSYYLKMFISLFLPVGIFIFKQKELIALIATDVDLKTSNELNYKAGSTEK